MKTILTKNQYNYLKNKKLLSKNQWGHVQDSLQEKARFMKEDCILNILKLVNEEDRTKIVNNVFYCLDVNSLDNLLNQYIQKKNKALEILNYFKSIHSGMYEHYKNILYQKSFKESLNILMLAEKRHKLKFIKKDPLKNISFFRPIKIASDFSFIKESEFRKDLFIKLLYLKRPIRFNQLLIRKNQRDQYIIKGFYERGILLPQNITKASFTKLLKNKFISNEKYLFPLREGNLDLKYKVYSFNKKSGNIFIKLNPFYRDYFNLILKGQW